MFIVNTVRIFCYQINKSFLVKLGFIIGIICFFRSFPWNEHNLVDIFRQGYDVFSSLGLVIGFLLVIEPITELYQEGNNAVSMVSRDKLALNCAGRVFILSFMFSVYYILVTFTAAAAYVGNINAWQNETVKLYDVDYYTLAVKSIIIIFLFLGLCGNIYTLIVRSVDNKILAFIITTSLMFLDLGQTLYTNKSLLLSYVYPGETHLHIENKTFLISMIYLILLNIIIIIFLIFATEKMNFVSKGKKRGKI